MEPVRLAFLFLLTGFPQASRRPAAIVAQIVVCALMPRLGGSTISPAHSACFPCGGARYHFLTALRVDKRGVSCRVNVWFECSVRPLDRGLREQKQDSKRRAKIAT